MEQTNEQSLRMTIYLPSDVYAQLRNLAKKHRRSYSREALWLIEQSIGQQELKRSAGVRG